MKTPAYTRAAIAAMLVAACATGTAHADEYVWSMDLDCTPCHQKEAVSIGLAEPTEEAGAEDKDEVEADKTDKADTSDKKDSGADQDVRAIEDYTRMHAELFDITCTTCHIESEGLDKAHEKLNSGKTSKRLKKSEVDATACASCHKAEALAKATAECNVLTDTNGKVVNPHDLAQNDSHANIQCFDCHQSHSDKAIESAANITCNSCHHAGAYECGTCHEAL